MPVYMVDRDLPGIQMEQLAVAQKVAIDLSQKMTAQGKLITTSLDWSRTGKARSMTASIKLKIAVLAPTPSASVSTATTVKPELAPSMRKP
jgi:prolyl oligopeptidase PreP (S9A serine peptidase family)